MLSVEAKERFLQRIKFKGQIRRKKLGHCWDWTGRLSESGYGCFDAGGKGHRAHRISYKLFVGDTHGLQVLHECDNPRCVRPKHLWLGTPADNAHDRDAKGRQVSLAGDLHPSRTNPEILCRGNDHWTRKHPSKTCRGTQHGRAKLNDTSVYLARALNNLGCTYQKLGKAFAVDRSAIASACMRDTWKHVDEPPKNLNIKMWYKKHKNQLTPATRELVESLIKVYVYS